MEITDEKVEKEIERIVEVLKFFSTQQTTFSDWLDQTQRRHQYCDEEIFFNSLYIAGFLRIPEHKNDTNISFYNEHSNKIYVTKEGYSFLNSHKFNKQSLEINKKALAISDDPLKTSKNVRNISYVALVIAGISLIVTIYNIIYH